MQTTMLACVLLATLTVSSIGQPTSVLVEDAKSQATERYAEPNGIFTDLKDTLKKVKKEAVSGLISQRQWEPLPLEAISPMAKRNAKPLKLSDKTKDTLKKVAKGVIKGAIGALTIATMVGRNSEK